MKQMLSSWMKKREIEYILFAVRPRGERGVLCLDVSGALLHECLLEAAAGKIIKGLDLFFL